MSRNMPSKRQIKFYWADALTSGPEAKFDSPEELFEADYCFACGFENLGTERAHILPKCEGGTDMPDNLHLLCQPCHQASEGMSGRPYWQWFWSRTIYDVMASIFIAQRGVRDYLRETSK